MEPPEHSISYQDEIKLLHEASENKRAKEELDTHDSALELTQDWPVLLLPVRLETRLIKDELYIRVYPDQIFIDTHRPELTPQEQSAGHSFYEIYLSNVSVDEKQDAWRSLARDFGPLRAAWIFHAFQSDNVATLTEDLAQSLPTPTLKWLPERFCFQLYYLDRHGDEQLLAGTTFEGNKIPSGLPIINLSSNGHQDNNLNEAGPAAFSGEANWMINFDEAEANGMAIKINLRQYDEVNPERMFSRIIVTGLADHPAYKTANTSENNPIKTGLDLITELFDSHHYTSGLGFIPYGTPTNNTQTTRSGYSESTEDREESYKTEVSPPEELNTPDSDPNAPQMNAERLAVALGLINSFHQNGAPPIPKMLRHLKHANERTDDYAKFMQTTVWPSSAEYFLRYLVNGLNNQEPESYIQTYNYLEQHFREYVRARGPLPAIRVGSQPYGILPATNFRNWRASDKDALNTHTGLYEFDGRLHRFLLGLFDLWLTWANDSARVPRVEATDKPMDELKQIIGMEATSFACNIRTWVDERFIASLIVSQQNNFNDLDTPYPDINEDPEYWLQQWAENWRSIRHDNAELWGNLSGIPVEQFAYAPFLRLLSWGDAKPLTDKSLVSSGEETPGAYLPEMYRIIIGEDDSSSLDAPSNTIYRDLLTRAIQLIELSKTDASERSIKLGRILDAICGPPLLGIEEIQDPLTLIQTLHSDSDAATRPISQFIWAQLDRNTRSYLLSPDTTLQDKHHTLVYVLNQILQRESIFDAERFKNITLRPLTQSLLAEEPSDHNLIYLNRLLLEDCFPWIGLKCPSCDNTTKEENRRLCHLSDAELEKLLLETFDLLSHRLDAWITSFATKRLLAMRRDEANERNAGIYLGAYGWVENFTPRTLPPQSWGYIHTPSLAQASAAAVLYNSYRVHDNDTDANPFRINLNSERVRNALHLINGIREGQTLGALLGYQFERQLHEMKLDRYIDRFRAEFPPVANKVTPPTQEESSETIAARNVVDGLALARWWENQRDNPTVFITTAHKELFQLINRRAALSQALDSLVNNLDAVCDTLLYESTFQAAQGRLERAGAAIDAFSGTGTPPEIESLDTYINEKIFGHRVCLLLIGDPPTLPNNSEKQSDKTPRELAEPRLAAWINKVMGHASEIGCHYAFQAERIDLNKATADELSGIPGITPDAVQLIIDFRTNHSSFSTLEDLSNNSEIDPIIIDKLNQYAMTGYEENEADKFFQHDDALSLLDLHISALDLLYFSAAALDGGSEIEQLIAYHVRRKHNLNQDVRININFTAQNYKFHLTDALEFAARIRKALGRGNPLLSDSLFPSFTSHLMPLSPDLTELKDRMIARLTDVETLIGLLSKTSNSQEQLKALQKASFYGIPGGIPLAPTEQNLQARCDRVRSELEKRRDECHLLIPDNNSIKECETSVEAIKVAYERLIKAAKALFGEDFLILPTLKANLIGQDLNDNSQEYLQSIQNQQLRSELKQAFLQTNLLSGQGEERVRLWLQQAGETHPPLRHFEDIFIFSNVWRQDAENQADDGLFRLQALQLPFDANNRWLALSDSEKGGDANSDIDGSISIVAIISELDNRNTSSPSAESELPPLAGFVLEQWEESIPDTTVDTAAAFKYTSPNAQAPQVLLLAVPSQLDDDRNVWNNEELAEIVKDTMDLAKVRAVDLEAMGDANPVAEGYEAGVGSALPGLMFDQEGVSDDALGPVDYPDILEEWIVLLLKKNYTYANFHRENDNDEISSAPVKIGNLAKISGESEDIEKLGKIASYLKVERNGKSDSFSALLLETEKPIRLTLEVTALAVKLIIICLDESVQCPEDVKSKNFITSVHDENGRLIPVKTTYDRLINTNLKIDINKKTYPVFELTLKGIGIKSILLSPQKIFVIDKVGILNAAIDECNPSRIRNTLPKQ